MCTRYNVRTLINAQLTLVFVMIEIICVNKHYLLIQKKRKEESYSKRQNIYW